MHRPDFSTSTPLLAPGEPGCCELVNLTDGARRALLSAALGSLRRFASGWYGPDKLAPIRPVTVRALMSRGLMFQPHSHMARLTKRGLWCARTLGTELAGLSYRTDFKGVSRFIIGENDATPTID